MRNGMRRGGEFLSNPRAGRKQRQRRNFHVPNSLDMSVCACVYVYTWALPLPLLLFFEKYEQRSAEKVEVSRWNFRERERRNSGEALFQGIFIWAVHGSRSGKIE